MKIRIVLLSLFLISGVAFAQKSKAPKSIISEKAAIKKYHSKSELERLSKGDLLKLYVERVEGLIETLPYIAFATKPGITMSSLGIPNTNDNRKLLEDKFEYTNEFIEKNREFQAVILPYSDTENLISAILYYEETLKSLHQYNEFH